MVKKTKKEPKQKEVYFVKNEQACGFNFDSGDGSLQVFAPDAHDLILILNNLLLCSKVQQILGYEEQTKKEESKNVE